MKNSKSTDSQLSAITEVVKVREALFYEEYDENSVICKLCPHSCVISNSKTGLCKVRMNKKGVLYSMNYGEISSISMDPIEKKPLFHFYPGTDILSIGSWGCNFKCPFCQNWQISQEEPGVQRIDPVRLVSIALEHNSKGIAYTYNEPMVWFEFVLDSSRLATKEGIYNVLVTNGFIELEPLKLLLQSVQAMNIDLKGFNEEFYRKVCKGELKSVMKVIEKSVEHGVHVEITTLIIPDENDNIKELREEFKWLSSLNPDIPLHISRYFPNYKYSAPPTPVEKLVEAYENAREFLNFVYIGNLWDKRYESTYCPDCGELVIEREGYSIKFTGLDEEGKCRKCGRDIVKNF
ncbi:MAG: pyruvate formate lyase activating enzyme [Thermotogaceae bacterium]|nr:pyruvate formate lyase activating enzyme [Thermotogaceae bacterium]